MAKFCRNCGSRLVGSEKFCQECGSPVQATVTPAGKPEPAQSQQTAAPRIAVPAHRATPQMHDNPQPTAQTTAMPAPEPVRVLPQEVPDAAAPSGKAKKHTGLALFMALLIAGGAAFAGFQYPGFLREKESSSAADRSSSKGSPENSEPAAVVSKAPVVSAEMLAYLGVTQEQLDAYYADPILPNAENSPGNPAFLSVTYTQDDYAKAETLSAEVSQENPEADFPDFGIHVDLKSWNLEHETDTLTVKRLPEKACSVTGATLYAFDYSLSSGQKEFATEVAVTQQIQGDPAVFTGMVHQNAEGAWEEDYYTLSEDGKSVTAYMTHFSGSAQVSDTDALTEIQNTAQGAWDYYRSDGESIFRLMPKEDRCKYENVNTWLYGIGLIRTPDFEEFMKRDDAYANAVLQNLLDNSGGITPEAGSAEFWGTCGARLDDAAMIDTLHENLNSSLFHGDSFSELCGVGLVISTVGQFFLAKRIIDQYQRGVSAGDIAASNGWSAVSQIISGCSILAALSGAAPAVILLAVVSGAIYGHTLAEQSNASRAKKYTPLGQPKDIGEAVFAYYCADYNDGTDNAVQHALQRVIQAIPPPSGGAHAIGYDTLTDFRGNGWTAAFNYIFTHYQKNPVAMGNAIQKMCTEYEQYIDRFYDGLGGREGDSAALREAVLRDYCTKMLNDDVLRYDYLNWVQSHSEGEAVRLAMDKFGYSKAHATKMVQLTAAADKEIKAAGTTWDAYWAERSLSDICTWDDSSDYAAQRANAKQSFYSYMNPVLYAFYMRFNHEALKEVRKKLLDEVLPFFNTQLTFYVQDQSLAGGQTNSETKYNIFQFSDIAKHSMLEVANTDRNLQFENRPKLEKRDHTPILLVTNVFNYVRWGCPRKVDISDGLKAADGIANWSKVQFRVDTDILSSGLNLSEQYQKYLKEEVAEKGAAFIRDVRIPIVYEKRPKEEKQVYSLEFKSSNEKINTEFYGVEFQQPQLTVTINPDHTIDFVLPKVEQRSSGSGMNGTYVYEYTRNEFTAHGVIEYDETDATGFADDQRTIRGPLTVLTDTITVTETHTVQNQKSTLKDGSSDIYHHILPGEAGKNIFDAFTSDNKIKHSTDEEKKSYFNIFFDAKTGQLKHLVLTLYGQQTKTAMDQSGRQTQTDTDYNTWSFTFVLPK